MRRKRQVREVEPFELIGQCNCKYPDFCDLCAPVEHYVPTQSGVCPECAIEPKPTHLHIVSDLPEHSRYQRVQGVNRRDQGIPY